MKNRYLLAGLTLLIGGSLYASHICYKSHLKSKLREELRPEIEQEYAARIEADVQEDERAIKLAMSVAANQDGNPSHLSTNELRTFFHELGIPTKDYSFQEGQFEYHIDRTKPKMNPVSFYFNNVLIGYATREMLANYINNHAIAHK